MHAESERDIGGERPCVFCQNGGESGKVSPRAEVQFRCSKCPAKYRLIDAPPAPIVVDENDSHSSEETADLGSLVKAGMFVGDPCADMTEVGARETLREDLEIKNSNIAGAGLGVFAKVPISSGTTVGSYWGALKSVPVADKCDLGDGEEHSRWVKMKKTTIIDKKKYR